MSMGPALTLRKDLDAMPCAGCGHTGQALYLACPEHRTGLTLAFYREGELLLECAECGTMYMTVPVAG
jgi:Zn ribbon nucleic-acid-binding protein